MTDFEEVANYYSQFEWHRECKNYTRLKAIKGFEAAFVFPQSKRLLVINRLLKLFDVCRVEELNSDRILL